MPRGLGRICPVKHSRSVFLSVSPSLPLSVSLCPLPLLSPSLPLPLPLPPSLSFSVSVHTNRGAARATRRASGSGLSACSDLCAGGDSRHRLPRNRALVQRPQHERRRARPPRLYAGGMSSMGVATDPQRIAVVDLDSTSAGDAHVRAHAHVNGWAGKVG